MRSNAAEQAIGDKLTGLLADGTWVPTATVQFTAVIGAVLADWMAVWGKD
jgi:hypothetical protein